MTTITKLFRPYIPCGRIPMKLLSHIPKTGATDVATTFHYFQLLPFELRAQIYEMAMASETHTARINRKWDDYHKDEYGRDNFYGQSFIPKVRLSVWDQLFILLLLLNNVVTY
jgi:hypothetical protein